MTRAVWQGSDGALRVGRSGDMVTMLDDLRVPRIGDAPPRWLVEFRIRNGIARPGLVR